MFCLFCWFYFSRSGLLSSSGGSGGGLLGCLEGADGIGLIRWQLTKLCMKSFSSSLESRALVDLLSVDHVLPMAASSTLQLDMIFFCKHSISFVLKGFQ